MGRSSLILVVARRVGWHVIVFILSGIAVVFGVPLLFLWAIYCATGAPLWGPITGDGRCR